MPALTAGRTHACMVLGPGDRVRGCVTISERGPLVKPSHGLEGSAQGQEAKKRLNNAVRTRSGRIFP